MALEEVRLIQQTVWSVEPPVSDQSCFGLVVTDSNVDAILLGLTRKNRH